jgi:hypothetical protein
MGSTGFICCNKDDLVFAQTANAAQLSPIIPPMWREVIAVDTTPKSVFELKPPVINMDIYYSNMGESCKKRYNRKGQRNKYF